MTSTQIIAQASFWRNYRRCCSRSSGSTCLSGILTRSLWQAGICLTVDFRKRSTETQGTKLLRPVSYTQRLRWLFCEFSDWWRLSQKTWIFLRYRIGQLMDENWIYNYEWQLSWKTNISFPNIFFRSSTRLVTSDQGNHFSRFAKRNYSPSAKQPKAKTIAVATHRKSYRWNASWSANLLIHRFLRKSLSTPASLTNFLTQSLFFCS